MDNMRPLNLLRSNRGPILCLLWLFGQATLTSGAATGVNRFSAFSQPVGPFTVVPDDEEIVVRLPLSHSSVRNFGGQEAPRAQQNFGIPLSFSPQGNGFNQKSLERDTQEPHHSPKFFVLNEDSNGNDNGRINTAVRSHFVTPGSKPRGIPLDVVNQRLSSGITSEAANSAQTPNPSSRFFVLQDDDLNFNVRANSVRSNGFSGTANGNGANRGTSLQLGNQVRSNGISGNTNGNGASRGIPLPLGNQGNTFKPLPKNSSPISNGLAPSSNPSSTFFVVENSAEVEDNLAIMSLGRRFHPNGIPIISNPIETPVTNEASGKTPEVQSPFLLTPNSLFVLKDESIEDLRDDDVDEQKIVVDLSPMVKAHNHNTANERLSLSSNFLNQYNFVDVKGSTSFGYKTDDQYQDHIVHRSGKHEGKFGWTAPEGSKHHIEYIADEKGYRVITSSGIYLNDEATVKAAKDNHFNEHKKVLDNLASMKRNNVLNSEQAQSKQSGTFGIPLPETMIKGQGESSATGPQPGIVVIESDNDIPLLSQEPDDVIVPIQYPDETFGGVAEAAAAGSSINTGIPLPEIPVRAEGSSVKPSQPTSSQGGSQFVFTFDDPENIVVPIQYPEETFGGAAMAAEKPAAGGTGSSPTIGIPIPESPVRSEGSSMEPSQPTSLPGGSHFGITLQDPEDVIVPIQYPEETFGGAAIAPAKRPVAGGTDSSPAFGIPIPETPVRAEGSIIEPSQTTFPQDGSQFEITLQDQENVFVPIQYPEETFEGVAMAAGKPAAGGTGSSPTFGIPIPESPVRSEGSSVEPSQPTSLPGGSHFGITLQDPEDVIIPIQYPEETFGGAAIAPAKRPVAGGTDSSPAFGIPIPETPVRAEGSNIEPSQTTFPQDGSQFGITLQGPENVFVPIQYPEETFGGASAAPVERPVAGGTEISPAFGIPIPKTPVITETQHTRADTQPMIPSETETSPADAEFSGIFGSPMSTTAEEPVTGEAAAPAERPVAGGAESSPAFGIPIPKTPVRTDSSPVKPSQTTFPQGGSQFGITLQDPENIIVPIQYPEETFGGAAAEPAIGPLSGGTTNYPSIATPIQETEAKHAGAETQPMIPSETAQTSPAENEFSEIFGPQTSSNKETPKVPGAITVESPKLSVKIGLEETAPNQIEGFGVGLPSPIQTEEQDLNPITGTGGFTVIREDQPFIALNNELNNVASNSEVNVPTDNVRPGGSTFSNQFFVVSPVNANQGVGLFPDETAIPDGGNPSDLLQGPPFANNEKKNLIRRRF